MKLKILIKSFTSCSGCTSALFSLDIFPEFLERTNILYFPFITDEEMIKEVDIALIEGCICEKSQVNSLKEIRKQAKKVYALGTCATYGGIINLSKKRTGEPIANYIEIDGSIPGCPPPSNLFGNYLMSLIENKIFKLSTRNMCLSCPRQETLEIGQKKSISKLFPENDELESKDELCFLQQGVLCLGPITRDGCDHKCINLGLPCEGCLGPVSKDFSANLINFLSLFKVSPDLQRYKGIFYRFSKPSVSR